MAESCFHRASPGKTAGGLACRDPSGLMRNPEAAGGRRSPPRARYLPNGWPTAEAREAFTAFAERRPPDLRENWAR